MKIKLNRSIIVILFVLCFSSCIKDETNTNFTDVILPDSVIIVNVTDPEALNPKRVKFTESGGNFAGSFESFSGVELRIEANVFYQGPYDIGYEWILNGKVISTDKILSYTPVDGVSLRLNVKRGDDKAGCDYRINLIVTHEFASGLYVMGKEGGKTVLDFFRYSTKEIESDYTGKPGVYKLPQFTENPDVFTLYNEYEMPCTDPIGMQWMKSKNFDKNGYAIQLLDKDYKKSVAINVATMKVNARLVDEWIGTPEDFVIKGMSDVYYTSVLLAESGNLYLRTNYDFGAPNTGRFSSSPLGFNDPLDSPDMGWQKIDATLHCMTKLMDTKSLIYEKSKKRFLALVLATDTGPVQDETPDKIEVMKLPTVATGTNGVDLNKFDKEILFTLPDGGADVYTQGNIDIIYKEGETLRIQANNLSYSISGGVSYSIVYNSELSPALTALLKTEGVHISKDKDASIPRKAELYVAAGKKLYVSNMTGTVMEELGTFDSNLIHFRKLSPWTTTTATEANYYSGRVGALAFANGDFKIIKFYKDPNKPGEILQEVLAEKKYDGGFVDSKFIYSKVIMGY